MLCQLVPEKCIACGLCQIKAPGLFDYTAEGIVIFKDQPQVREKKISATSQAELLAAYRKCPTRAITIAKS